MPTLITTKKAHRASVNEAGAGTRCSETLMRSPFGHTSFEQPEGIGASLLAWRDSAASVCHSKASVDADTDEYRSSNLIPCGSVTAAFIRAA